MTMQFQKFTISQVAIIKKDDKFLILEDAANPGKYILPGGRIDEGELSEPAFRREIKEELNVDEFKIRGLVDYDIWYIPSGVGVSALAFLVELDADTIKLSDEHLSFRWVTDDELDDVDFLWPNARRMIRRGMEPSVTLIPFTTSNCSTV